MAKRGKPPLPEDSSPIEEEGGRDGERVRERERERKRERERERIKVHILHHYTLANSCCGGFYY